MKFLIRLGFSAAFVALLLLLPLLLLDKSLDAPVEISIERGDTPRSIGNKLEQAGIIRSATAFGLWVRLRGVSGALQRGLYRFEASADLFDVVERLVSGKAKLFHVTVIEGLRTDEVLQQLARQTHTDLTLWQKALAEVVADANAEGELEGLLLPETYSYMQPLDPVQILRRMREDQQKVLDALSSDPGEQRRLVTMASVIEKETSLDAERPLVSAVLHNRIKIGMPLQMDPTVIYGLWRMDGKFSGNLHKRDMERDTPWNTYRHRGLPPTPIGNPGKASLHAAANPAEVDYLYFVADGSGGHHFASSYADHQNHVQRWIALERSNP